MAATKRSRQGGLGVFPAAYVLVGSEAVHEGPAPAEAGPAGQMAHGAERARAEVTGTTAMLIWPARLTWVGPETITSLIEAHGPDRSTVLLPGWQGEPGWPVLVPLVHLDTMRGIAPDRMPLDIVHELVRLVPARVIEMGDPGVIHDVDTAPADLPAYEGPPDPPAGHTHEWGADVATEAGLPEP